MRHPDTGCRLGPPRLAAVLLACALVSACASRPGPEPAPAVTPEPDSPSAGEATPTQPPPAPAVQPPAKPTPAQLPCAWSKIRGVATLLAIAESPPARGTWQFFPGDEVVFHPVPESASTGDEFKALLRRPMSGGCKEPELVLFGPV